MIAIDGEIIHPWDARHPSYDDWCVESEMNHWPDLHAFPEVDYPEGPPRSLILEPLFAVIYDEQHIVGPSSAKHPEHALYRAWQLDIRKDSSDDRKRRSIMEREAESLRQTGHGEFIAFMSQTEIITRYTIKLERDIERYDSRGWLGKFLTRVYVGDPRERLAKVKKYSEHPIV